MTDMLYKDLNTQQKEEQHKHTQEVNKDDQKANFMDLKDLKHLWYEFRYTRASTS